MAYFMANKTKIRSNSLFINTFPICRTIQYRQTGLNSSEDVRACA